MMRFPGGSKKESFISGRNPQTSDYLVVSKMDLNVGTEEMYAWSHGRRSVRSFYKLYDALFACSTTMNV